MNTEGMAAMASVTENETYLGNRLQFERELEYQLTGEVTGRLVGRFFKRGLALALLAAVVVVLIELLDGGSSGRSYGGYYYSSGSSFDVTPVIWCALIVFLLSLLLPYREGLSEWELLLDGKAAAADTAYAAIYGTLRTRQIPVSIGTRRFRTSGDSTVNNFLVVGQKPTYVYVCVFPYGTSLYLGWQMWRRRLPVRLLARWVADGVGSAFGRDWFFSGQLASNKTRALREAVHSAVREGVDAVNYGLDIPVAATFGHDVPVETLGVSPQPGPVAPQPLAASFALPVTAAASPVPPVAMTPPVPPIPAQGGAW